MPSTNNKIDEVLGPVLLGAATALFAATAFGVVVAFARMSPQVGDIVTFTPSNITSDSSDASRIVAHRPDQFGCVLDLETMQRDGGSLVIEARLAGDANRFQLHWAGPHTTADSGDCGRSAELILDNRDLDQLAVAAGGYGLGPKRTPVILTAVAD